MTVRPAAEDDARGNPARERAWAVHADAQRVEVLLSKALDLFVLEDGVAHNVGENRHRRAGLRGEDVDGCARGVPARAGVELASERFDLLRYLRRGARLRPLRQKLAGPVGDAARLRRFNLASALP